MFYLLHRSGDGWTADSLDRCRFALASWRIRSEELLGPNSSILEHVADAGHMVDDIIRHGPSNVYWSYGSERLVVGYNKVKTNNRNMEHSFTFHYARVLFAKCMVQIWEDDDGLLPHERAVRLLHSHMCFSTSRLSERMLEDECQPWHSEGVCVVFKRSKVCTIHRGLKVYLSRFWRESEATSRGEEIPEISDRIVQLKTVLIRGKVLKPGDHVIVLDETRADLAYEWNWKGRIVSCFYHSYGNKTQMFFEFRWLYNKTESNVQTVDPISVMQLLHPTELSHAYENWRPAMQVAYHFFPYVAIGMETYWHWKRRNGRIETFCSRLRPSVTHRRIPNCMIFYWHVTQTTADSPESRLAWLEGSRQKTERRRTIYLKSWNTSWTALPRGKSEERSRLLGSVKMIRVRGSSGLALATLQSLLGICYTSAEISRSLHTAEISR
ncbi:hypothetical protein R1sor_017536 [Riccia sorocarpa]|uniref:Uncharacterized protein n=1 Tax=Riccia sorocarpa TaxID=122646 RepID=A0ABD3IDC6_9MARC